MAKHKIAFISATESDTKLLEEQLVGLDYEMDAQVCKSHGETIEAVKGADVIVNHGVLMPREVIEEIDAARAIVSTGHGFDRIDHNAATDQGVMVVNTAGGCTEEVSNHTIMLLLACTRKLAMLNNYVKNGTWKPGARPQLLPMEPIDGQTLGLVGFGNIGRGTARKAKAFGLEVVVYDPYVQPWIARENKVTVVGSLEELARR